MVIRISKKTNGNYDITTRGGITIHSDKPLDFCIGYLNNQLQTGFVGIRVII